jgi:excisionase family DNA binding protein
MSIRQEENLNVERLTISVEQAGVMLGVSRVLAYQMANNGQLPVIRCGRRLLVSRRALEAMLDAPPAPSKPQA